MNNDIISLSDLINAYYSNHLNKGSLLRTLENYINTNEKTLLLYADVNYYISYGNINISDVKKDINALDKIILKTTNKIYLHRKKIDNKNIEFVTFLFIYKDNTVKIDTEIFEHKNNKIKKYWISQIKDFESYLKESNDLLLRKIDGLLLDVAEVRNEVLIKKENIKKLKRFMYLEMD